MSHSNNSQPDKLKGTLSFIAILKIWVLQQYATTQLYSNLVNLMYNTTYLCLVLAVLWSLVFSRVRLPSLHTTSHIMSPIISINVQLSKCFPFILITENKGWPTHGFKTKNLFCLMEVWTSCSRKDASG